MKESWEYFFNGYRDKGNAWKNFRRKPGRDQWRNLKRNAGSNSWGKFQKKNPCVTIAFRDCISIFSTLRQHLEWIWGRIPKENIGNINDEIPGGSHHGILGRIPKYFPEGTLDESQKQGREKSSKKSWQKTQEEPYRNLWCNLGNIPWKNPG